MKVTLNKFHEIVKPTTTRLSDGSVKATINNGLSEVIKKLF